MFTANQFRDFMFAQTTPNAVMINFIKKLKKKYGLQIAAVSNEARELTEYRIQTFRLKELIDFFIFSCYVHVRKPHAEIFRLALDIAFVHPEQVIYIDDVEMFTEVASALGIKSIHHIDLISTSNQIKAMGLTIEESVVSYV
jgi:putative hydrolase of the HAD superfamily